MTSRDLETLRHWQGLEGRRGGKDKGEQGQKKEFVPDVGGQRQPWRLRVDHRRQLVRHDRISCYLRRIF